MWTGKGKCAREGGSVDREGEVWMGRAKSGRGGGNVDGEGEVWTGRGRSRCLGSQLMASVNGQNGNKGKGATGV